MPGRSPGAVLDLLPAGNAGRRDDRLPCLGPDSGEEPEFADAHGGFVVLRLEAKGPGHAAAPGVDLDDFGTWDAAEQGRRRGSPRERLLVAVAVEQDAPATAVLLRQDEPARCDGLQEEFLRQPRGGCYGLRSRVAGEKG